MQDAKSLWGWVRGENYQLLAVGSLQKNHLEEHGVL